MFKKSFSQKVAKAFEVFGFLVLVPSLLSIIFPLIGLIGSLMKLSLEGIFYSATCLVLFGAGLILLVGYFKHSRALIDEEKIIPLWVGTFLFNLILFVPSIYSYASYIVQTPYDELEINLFFIIWGGFVLWLAIAIMLSIFATISEVKENQK